MDTRKSTNFNFYQREMFLPTIIGALPIVILTSIIWNWNFNHYNESFQRERRCESSKHHTSQNDNLHRPDQIQHHQLLFTNLFTVLFIAQILENQIKCEHFLSTPVNFKRFRYRRGGTRKQNSIKVITGHRPLRHPHPSRSTPTRIVINTRDGSYDYSNDSKTIICSQQATSQSTSVKSDTVTVGYFQQQQHESQKEKHEQQKQRQKYQHQQQKGPKHQHEHTLSSSTLLPLTPPSSSTSPSSVFVCFPLSHIC